MTHQLLAEVMSTALMIIFGVGVHCDDVLKKTKYAGTGHLFAITTWAFGITVCLFVFGGVSMNPAMALLKVLLGKLTIAQFFPIAIAEMIGAFLGALIAYFNPQVEKVNHPSLPDHPDHALYEKYFPNGGASIFTFNIKGGREEAFKFIDNLKVFSLLANVADVKSLVIHPASTTHSQLNDEELAEQQIYQNTIRLSIGTEHIDDIIADLEAGFAAVRGE